MCWVSAGLSQDSTPTANVDHRFAAGHRLGTASKIAASHFLV